MQLLSELKSFEGSIAHALVHYGEAFEADPEATWGDTRGRNLWEIEQHVESCGVGSLADYQENYQWRIYDTITETTKMGLSGRISCNCGTVSGVLFVIPEASLTDVIKWVT